MPFKHNGPAHLAVLFLAALALTTFWIGQGMGMPDAIIGTGLKLYDAADSFSGSNLADLEDLGPFRTSIAAIITLIILYLASAGLLTVLNTLWNKPEQEMAPPEIKIKPPKEMTGLARKVENASDTTELAKQAEVLRRAMATVKMNGLAHLALIVILFFLSSAIFGGGLISGPVPSGLIVGWKAYQLVMGVSANPDAAFTLAPSLLSLIITFIINLIIYYIASAVLIFVFNVLFNKKVVEKTK